MQSNIKPNAKYSDTGMFTCNQKAVIEGGAIWMLEYVVHKYLGWIYLFDQHLGWPL